MKIISWNVNGARSSAKRIVELLTEEQPDVLLLQEIKCDTYDMRNIVNDYFPEYTVFVSESYRTGHFGVATIVLNDLIEDEEGNLLSGFQVATSQLDPLVDGQKEGRLIAMVVDGTLILNTYTVNVRRDLSRRPQRNKYDQEVMGIITGFRNHFKVERVVYMGDLNVVPEPIDYYGREIKPRTPGMTETERENLSLIHI